MMSSVIKYTHFCFPVLTERRKHHENQNSL